MITPEKAEELYRKQVLKTFFKNGMLLQIPTQNRKKDVVMQKVATRFQADKMYTDAELNEVLQKLFADFEKLKIEFLGSRFMKKNKDGLYHLA
ncbi:MAG: DUF2087 domain-containing protein [Pseudobdellovibrio sp.]